MKKTNANIVVYATDSKTSKRKEIYSIYKEKRQKNKTDKQIALDAIAHPQFDEIIESVIPTIGYKNVFGAEGFEADDIIARICKKYKDEEIVICSTDQDLYQLLTDNVCMMNSKTNNWYSKLDFTLEYGIEPKMWKRVKAIGGCISDNVDGIPGVGEKTVIKYLTGNLPSHHKTYMSIISGKGKKITNRNKQLVILPMRGTPDFTIKPDRLRSVGLRKVCDKYGFQSITDDWRSWKNTLGLK